MPIMLALQKMQLYELVNLQRKEKGKKEGQKRFQTREKRLVTSRIRQSTLGYLEKEGGGMFALAN